MGCVVARECVPTCSRRVIAVWCSLLQSFNNLRSLPPRPLWSPLWSRPAVLKVRRDVKIAFAWDGELSGLGLEAKERYLMEVGELAMMWHIRMSSLKH